MTAIDFGVTRKKVKVTIILNDLDVLGLIVETVTKPFPVNNLRTLLPRKFRFGMEILHQKIMSKGKVMTLFVWKW